MQVGVATNTADSRVELRISESVSQSLQCPVCCAGLRRGIDRLVCVSRICGVTFPVVDGIPVLLNESASIFRFDEVVANRRASTGDGGRGVKGALRGLLPSISRNIGAEENYARFTSLLLALSDSPRVLVVGGGALGKGMQHLVDNGSVELVETDVSFGTRTSLICDAHDIPFGDETFDGVIVQAVLEHVVDPYRCVEEIHRVLKNQGLVYSETPFMQQVHMGRFDFTRFTHLGHRRLFRKFEEIESGAVCGPGMALAWAYQYFLLSFAASGLLRALLMAFARITSFPLKYFDDYLINKRGTFDSASGYYFVGRKGSEILPDRELIRMYRGAL